MIAPDIRELLETEAARINCKSFIADDPVQFPRRFTDVRDVEISALLTAIISWGRRPMILRDADRMLTSMDHQPYRFMMEEAYEAMNPDANIHRTFFTRHLQYFLRGLREIYKRHSTLDDFCRSIRAAETEAPAWHLVQHMQTYMQEANGGETCSECLPTNLDQTALKRINMALRWLVRDDGIVDLGVWQSIKPAQLYIPLDVHVARISRSLGLLERKSNDRKAVVQLTDKLRTLRPDDPAYYDFALFGIGVNSRSDQP